MAISIDALDQYLLDTWHILCQAYDVSAPMPDVQEIFAGANLRLSGQAAEQVLLNMLVDVAESVGRFSPWYTMPARAFGIMSVRDKTTGRVRWILAPEALERWCRLIEPLAIAISNNTAVIQATWLVDETVRHLSVDASCVRAICHCEPPRRILIEPKMLNKHQVVCECCRQSFYVAGS
jgi:hypothetical protein